MSNNALRYNQGKPDYTLLDFSSFEPMVRVLEFGARKYHRDNWRNGLSKHNLLGSLQRHVGSLIDKVNKGEAEVDSETLIHEIGHIMCNCMFYSALHIETEKQQQMSKDNIDWDALDRAERAINGGVKTSTAKVESDKDWEEEFFKVYHRFPNNQAELDSFIYDEEQYDDDGEEESESGDYDDDSDSDYEESYDEDEEEEEDEDDFSNSDDPIQAIIEKGERMEEASRPKQRWNSPIAPKTVTQAQIVPKKEKPVIVLQKSEKNDSFVDGFVKNDPRVRGLGFRTQDLL